ncbi:uncharacterized protein Z520_06020 [Fonsecaea multimorphosa CBS 102226]|uniref:Uncharacterized protein n=1 Tax=Fonsecaea multimorphosa CBS 102226 TaxID=1442371 RepID=A0A0D2JWN3_9EURO|nr:uncharacterized protein Z520_06020 [Fonsecaea multimorphosa CBS 102226]KIX97942.1 hypothetical protein Z520_06020 [Fonsecaea multimorphosa CBS 102226]OAL24315.1 hypothetical protein AYO22_05691 [Fonsecaea multimorphosa]
MGKQPGSRVPCIRSQALRGKHHPSPYVEGVPPQRVIVPPAPSNQASMDRFFLRAAAPTSRLDFPGTSQKPLVLGETDDNTDLNSILTADEHQTFPEDLEQIDSSGDYSVKDQSGSNIGTFPLLVDEERRKKRALESSPAAISLNGGIRSLHTPPTEKTLFQEDDHPDNRKLDLTSWSTA